MREKLTPRVPPRLQAPQLLATEYLRHLQPRQRRCWRRPRSRRSRRPGSGPPTGSSTRSTCWSCATGFKVFETGNMPPFEVRGAGGLSLEEWWDANRLQAYEGVSVPGFPNWFSILGPLRLQRPVLLRPDRDPDAPHRALPGTAPATKGARRVEITARGQPALLRVDARPPPQPDLLPGLLLELQQLLLRSSTATRPSGRASALEAAWRSARFDLDDYAFAA